MRISGVKSNIPTPLPAGSQLLAEVGPVGVTGGCKNVRLDPISHSWFNGGIKNHPLLAAEAILLREWNQCLSLIWFNESMKPAHERGHGDDDDEPLLKELDGMLSWPSKSRRR